MFLSLPLFNETQKEEFETMMKTFLTLARNFQTSVDNEQSNMVADYMAVVCGLDPRQIFSIYSLTCETFTISEKENATRYQEVVSRFNRNLRRNVTSVKISSAFYHRNASLESKFEESEKTLKLQYGDDDGRAQYQWVFHGTKSSNTLSIFKHNFSMQAIKRFVYGKGIYFSVDPTIALCYSERASPTKTLIVSKILPGAGRRVDCRNIAEGKCLCDSHVVPGNIFVMFDMSRVLPMYELNIECKSWSSLSSSLKKIINQRSIISKPLSLASSFSNDNSAANPLPTQNAVGAQSNVMDQNRDIRRRLRLASRKPSEASAVYNISRITLTPTDRMLTLRDRLRGVAAMKETLAAQPTSNSSDPSLDVSACSSDEFFVLDFPRETP